MSVKEASYFLYNKGTFKNFFFFFWVLALKPFLLKGTLRKSYKQKRTRTNNRTVCKNSLIYKAELNRFIDYTKKK